jgi:hypothetical protein
LGKIATLALVAGLQLAPDGDAPQLRPLFPAGSTAASPSGDVMVEACDGTRSAPSAAPDKLVCARWSVEWSQGGKVWGQSAADSLAALSSERERVLGYVRLRARLLGGAIDPRWQQPSGPICNACEQDLVGKRSGRFGDAQLFGGNPTQDAVVEVRAKLQALEGALADVHMPRVRDVARLARTPATAQAAKAYAKALDAAVIGAAALELELANAAIFRSRDAVVRAGKAIDQRIRALDGGARALAAAVAKAVARAHAGKYAEDPPGSAPSHLLVAFSGDKVTATFVQGPAQSLWFEGNVQLDGSVSGQSLVAPEHGKTTCSAHSLECGFVHVPAILRFDETTDGKAKRRTVELWFRQSTWVHARTFSR